MSELKITLLLVNIIVHTECQQSQNNAAGFYTYCAIESHVNTNNCMA